MTKQDFINRVGSKTGLSSRDAGKAVDAFMEVVTETLPPTDHENTVRYQLSVGVR